MSTVILVLSILLAYAALLIIAIHSERKWFNNGICPKCGTRLKYFDTDSQGGRGYTCEKSNYCTWVSWNTDDKKYWKDKK